jgi:hypothetical protein
MGVLRAEATSDEGRGQIGHAFSSGWTGIVRAERSCRSDLADIAVRQLELERHALADVGRGDAGSPLPLTHAA